MSDPIYRNNSATIKMSIKFESADKPIDIYAYGEKEVVKKIPSEKIESSLKEKLNLVSITEGTVIHGMSTSFQYADGGLKGFDYGNILIQANLPYCLHIPNFHEMEISIPEENFKALVNIEKVWTERSQTEDGSSDELDLIAQDRPLYFKKSTILGPQMPIERRRGWDFFVSGNNIEKIKDRNGVFRYSTVNIQLKMDTPKIIDNLSKDELDKIIDTIKQKTLSVINRLIDNYRAATNETHVRRLGEIKISLIYFIPQNQGYYLLDLGIETAMMNRSLQEIKSLSKKLHEGQKPEVYKLLLLNAKDSFETQDYTLAIVESFQALEIFLENYLVLEFKKQKVPEKDYKKILNKNWKTKDRLKVVLKEIKGFSLSDQTKIWDEWCTKYDKTRNEVIHAGKEPTINETRETLAINESVIEWVSSL